MSDTVISVENLGKKYRIRHQQRERYTALRDVIAREIQELCFAPRHSVTPPLASSTEDFWALKDVSFEVKQGEVVGIIGRNGAGKSTLLKILSRITEPTEGRVRIKGRVASLLEVGTGFHPELTGRENIFLNGAILGMTGKRSSAKFDEIVAFAEVEKFLDTPVKRYSSGMYVRLAFAVAAHLEPEILIVDEVLAVGDAEFQKKCLGKMGEVARGGRTVLFVSHNMPAIEILCSRGMLFDGGQIRTMGTCSKIISEYMRDTVERARTALHSGTTRHVCAFVLKSHDGEERDTFAISEDIIFEVELYSEEFIDNPRCGIAIYSPRGERLATLHTDVQQNANWAFRGTKRIRTTWRNVPLNVGKYRVDIALWGHANEMETLVGCRTLEIYPCDVYGTGSLPDPCSQGYLIPNAEWEMNPTEDDFTRLSDGSAFQPQITDDDRL